MKISDLSKISQLVHKQAPALLTAAGITGTVTTAYLSFKAGWKSRGVVDELEAIGGTADDPKQRLKERARLVWPLMIPPVASGVVTVGAIAFGGHTQAKRTAAATSVAMFTQQAFDSYKEKVVEEIGQHKEQVIRDDLASRVIDSNPPDKTVVIGNGKVLCCELYTRRYFESDHETLRKAQNDINAKVVHELYVTLDDFYDLVGLPHTSTSGELGWDSDKLLELKFTTTLSEDGKPCLAFDYNHIRPI